MTLTEVKRLLNADKWAIVVLVGIIIFSVVIYLKLVQKPTPATITLDISPDLPTLADRTTYDINLSYLQIPKTVNSYTQSKADQNEFSNIANGFGFNPPATTIKSKDGDILFWKKDNETLSISTSTSKLSYQKYFKTSEIKNDPPNEPISKQKVTDYLKKLNLTAQNIEIESPKITYYKDLIEGATPVTDSSYRYTVFEYQPNIQNIPVITINPLIPPVYASVGPGDEIFQLKVDLNILGTPKLEKTLKTKSIKTIQREIKSGHAAIISSTRGRLLGKGAQVGSFSSTGARLVYLKFNDLFAPVVEITGDAQVTNGEEEIIMITPLTENTIFLSNNK